MYHLVTDERRGKFQLKRFEMDCQGIRFEVERSISPKKKFVFIRVYPAGMTEHFVSNFCSLCTRINSYIMQPRVPASTRSPCGSAETANDHFVARRCTRCGRFSPTNLLGRRFYNFFCESGFRIRRQQQTRVLTFIFSYFPIEQSVKFKFDEYSVTSSLGKI